MRLYVNTKGRSGDNQGKMKFEQDHLVMPFYDERHP